MATWQYRNPDYPSHSLSPSPPPHGWFIDSFGHNLGTGPHELLNTIGMASSRDPSEITWEPFLEGGGTGYPFTDPLVPPSPTPACSLIPPLISTHGIDEGDVNVLLSSVSDLDFPTAFKTLLASTMALWASSAPDVAAVHSLGLDKAIDGFLEFLAPPPPTAVSPAPFPVDIPPTPSSASHLRTPMPCPLEKGKMRARGPSEVPADQAPPPVTPSPLPAPPAPIELVSPAIQAEKTGKKKGKKASFAEAAAKAVSKPGPPKPPLGPKADLAQHRSHVLALPPPRPSLVLSLTHHTLASTLCAKAALAPPVLVATCNAALSTDPIHANVRVSATKWTPKGNLVVFAGPGVTRDALFATSHILTSAVSRVLPEGPQISS